MERFFIYTDLFTDSPKIKISESEDYLKGI